MRSFSNTVFSLLIILAVQSCSTAQSVDRGLYSLANSVSSEDLITGQRKLSFAERNKQIQQGNAQVEKFINELKKQGKQINAELDAGQYGRVLRIFNKIHSVSHLRDEKWDVYLIPDESFNAFTTGGTSIVVNLGLMKELSFDDEVAAVIAHEISHVTANHVFERNAAMTASYLGGSNSVKTQAVQAGYSHNDEAEADKIGVLYMALAGYDPMAASRIWYDMYQKRGDVGQAYQSHPITSERLKNNKEIAEQVRSYYIPGKQNPNFENILANNVLWNKRASTTAPGAGGGVAAVAETFASYYIEKQNAQVEAARQTERITMLKDIQSNMVILGGDMLDNGEVGMRIKYTGARPVGKLAIRAVSPEASSLYRHASVIRPNDEYTARFSSKILQAQDGTQPKIKLVVDEGQYF